MASFKIYWKAATKQVKVIRNGDTAPGGYTLIKTVDHSAGEGDVIYHHVRDALYDLTPSVQNMQEIDIVSFDEVINVSAISVSPATVTLDTSDNATQKLTVTFTPTTPDNTNVTYTSSDITKATVTASGIITTAGVTGTGQVTITATSQDGGFTDTCVVTVVA